MANPRLSIVKSSQSGSLTPDKNRVRKLITSLNADKQLILELTNKLHSTLYLDKLITLFNLEITPILNLDDLIYNAPDSTETIDTKGRHLISYNLVVHKKALGEIALIRRTRFNIKEQKFIEKILVTLLAPLNNALEYQQALNNALRDPLTGAFNRLAMDNMVSRDVDLAQRNHAPLSMVALDIDFFKKVNDTYGHATGDRVLQHFTECVYQCTRHTDALFRYGGEEFNLLLNNTELTGAQQLAERIRKTVEQTPCKYNGEIIKITVSMGISLLTLNDTKESFFERADRALYQAKEAGRNQIICENRKECIES